MSNPFVNVYASIIGSEEDAVTFLNGYRKLDLAIPTPSEETNEEKFVANYIALPLSPIQISYDTMIPEEFASKYVAITLVLNQYLYTASTARSAWNMDKEDNAIRYLELDSLESAAYGEYLANNPGAKATDAKKHAAAVVGEAKVGVAEREAEIRAQIEACDNAIRYLNNIKEVMNAYAAIFPHVRDYQADAAKKFQGALVESFLDSEVQVVESEDDKSLRASVARRSIAQPI